MENKIYTEIYTVNCQFTQWIANLHSKLPIFRVKSIKIYTRQKKLYGRCPWRPWQISGMIMIIMFISKITWRQWEWRHCQVVYGYHDHNHPHHSFPNNLHIIMTIQTTWWQREWGHRQVGSPANSLEARAGCSRSVTIIARIILFMKKIWRNELSEQESKPTYFNGLVNMKCEISIAR